MKDVPQKQRLIFHCDCNNFFASCECLERPELKNVPLAVAGDPEKRTGVVFAKNELAKKCGVKTTDTVWQAMKKCPGLVFVPPRHGYYAHISRQVNQIYLQYTDRVEPASIDESYLDLTGTERFYGLPPRELADEIRERVKKEIGITISVGVSFNKTFAKLGSDYKKPDATTVILGEDYKRILWPLPIRDMMFVGRASGDTLEGKGIKTIGDLALTNPESLTLLLGKGGESLWRCANGLDEEPVRRYGERDEMKSVSHGATFPRDLTEAEDIRAHLMPLADAVTATLRANQRKGSVVQMQLKAPDLKVISRQATLPHPTFLYREIFEAGYSLVRQHWDLAHHAPLRAMTLGVTGLIPAEEAAEQLSLLEDPGGMSYEKRQRLEKLETAIDAIRQKHGKDAVSFGASGLKKEE